MVDMVEEIRLVVTKVETKVETKAKGMFARMLNLVVVKVVPAKVVDSLEVRVVTVMMVVDRVVPDTNLASRVLDPGLELRVTTGNLLVTLSPLLGCSMPPCVWLGGTLPTSTKITGPTLPWAVPGLLL